MEDIKLTNWWKYVDSGMAELMEQSFTLLDKFQEVNSPKQHDYSFIVFPAAKAYEGFLKKLFLDLKLINRQQFYGDHFRIGRAMSPTLPKRYRIGWVYGKLAAYCGGEELPVRMWEVWKRARNRVFHYFPQHFQCLNYEEAKVLVTAIADMMEEALAGCKVAQT